MNDTNLPVIGAAEAKDEDTPFAVNEIFGPTIQGEGPYIGHPCLFLRLHHCPVQCPGCDTAYTWNKTEAGDYQMIGSILAHMDSLCFEAQTPRSRLGLVVSGGEPLLYYRRAADLARILDGFDWTGLETSGWIGKGPFDTAALPAFLRLFSVVCLSPKITPCLHGVHPTEELERNIPLFLTILPFITRLIFKFVVRDQADVDAVVDCVARHSIRDRGHKIYVMPYGNDRDEILACVERLLPAAVRHGFIISPRLHSLIWGARRGK